MSNYECRACYHKHGLTVTVRTGGSYIGVPELEDVPSEDETVLIYRLIYRHPVQHHATACSRLIRQPSPNLRHIRILLPDWQEFVLISRKCHSIYHPVSGTITDYPPWPEESQKP